MLSRYEKARLKFHQYLGGETPSCVDCGSTQELEISHNDPESKELDPLVRFTHSWEKTVKPELDKCSLRCRKCHTTYDGKNFDPPHGTISRYHYGCKCDLCTKANTQRGNENRHKKGVIPRTEPQHGTYSMYSNHKCRCRLCKDAMNIFNRELRARKKANANGK